MRIAILTQSYPPMISGAAIFSCHLAESLAKRGHHVLVLAASDQGQSYCQESGNLKILRVQSLANPFRVGQRFVLLPLKEVQQSLMRFSPQVIHLHDPLQLADIALAYGKQAKIPCMVTLHADPGLVSSILPENPEVRHMAEMLLWGISTHLKKQVKVWVAPTRVFAHQVEKNTQMRPVVISGGVDLNLFNANRLPKLEEIEILNQLCIPGDVKIMLHVGRLDSGKNVRMVVESASELITSGVMDNIHLLVIGDGLEKPNLVKLTKKLGVEGNCHFPGYIKDKKLLASIYQLSDVFLMSSTIETQGLVLLEAAACGLPIVAVNATAIPEIVIHGINGYLVAPGDVRCMANSAKAILQDMQLSERMRLASRLKAEEHDFEKSVDAYESIYYSIAQGQPMVESLESSAVMQEFGKW